MSRRPPIDSGEFELSTSVLSLLSPSKASTLLEETGCEQSDGTPLALLGDNITSPSPEKHRNPPPSFAAIVKAHGNEDRASSKITELPPSTEASPTLRGSVVAKAENQLEQLQDDEPAAKDQPSLSDEETLRPSENSQSSIPRLQEDSLQKDSTQEDNIQDNSIQNDDVHSHETSIAELIWALLVTFGTVAWGTSRLVFFSFLAPLSFVKHPGLALFETSKLWLLFASQCCTTLRLITKRLILIALIRLFKVLTWALQLLIWSKTSQATPQSDEGPAGHSSDQPKANGGHQL
ncbi:hypothetical protein SMACR_00735 [Sordaria macrospora]|uniref:WGS project CABT00000000 data, contig 2.2 n=2 Tax=Sordaria macrospora TaxID=5147 RepID=F7VMY0_SORMK|nr:uncharacterized protein SMAC_00735 [Sordaria macrospora k-hell]KAA8635696.1 hypothetical protein SMACR_00735 [Sordaria macrospora]KAH7630122.1 hypothetical protein B0T09DRAFT_264108 [Sordaria sp. MPI-SDFR-AT-0083]CCC06709.1 unnamed protein product [Sordaria macrospora k-hell]